MNIFSIDQGRRGAGHAAVPFETAAAGWPSSTRLLDATPTIARGETGPLIDGMAVPVAAWPDEHASMERMRVTQRLTGMSIRQRTAEPHWYKSGKRASRLVPMPRASDARSQDCDAHVAQSGQDRPTGTATRAGRSKNV